MCQIDNVLVNINTFDFYTKQIILAQYIPETVQKKSEWKHRTASLKWSCIFVWNKIGQIVRSVNSGPSKREQTVR